MAIIDPSPATDLLRSLPRWSPIALAVVVVAATTSVVAGARDVSLSAWSMLLVLVLGGTIGLLGVLALDLANDVEGASDSSGSRSTAAVLDVVSARRVLAVTRSGDVDLPGTGAAHTSRSSRSVQAFRQVAQIIDRDIEPGLIHVAAIERGPASAAAVAHVGIGLTLAGHRVALLDVDLAEPTLHRYFEQRVAPGLCDILGGAQPKDVVRLVELGATHRLAIYSAGVGEPAADPSDLSGEVPEDPRRSRLMTRLLVQMAEHYQYVLIAAPPVGLDRVSLDLAAQATRTLTVVTSESRADAVERCFQTLDDAGVDVFGSILVTM
ncbi:MAG: tyrosine-protein kinase family protein [Ilumatobacter sp.]|jgi:Mrp family chromosome partitioning ATPase|uniref:tyrosine-protein kinase family protein n=1 Tax=Ilumatobacter sp. TaxID=1967498 RepID=UPI00391B02D2